MFETLAACCLLLPLTSSIGQPPSLLPSATISLDGNDWLLAVDPQNVGWDESWAKLSRPDARRTPVPWVIQDIFPDFHGVAWYWREFIPPANPHSQGRYLLRFWAVDYLAEVWVNGVNIGKHEGGETPFTLDATNAIRPGEPNLVAVRVLNPSDEPIDGITLQQTPHRNKKSNFSCGSDYNHGGIEDSVELLVTPAVIIEDMFVEANPNTDTLSVRAMIQNYGAEPAKGSIEWSVAPASGGATVAVQRVTASFAPGSTVVETKVEVANARLWELDDPYLYRVTARVGVDRSPSFDERSVRCGFRNFALTDNSFRLNGRRILLRCSVSGNMSPIGIHVPYDKDWLRRDLINVKMMGFNALRFYGLPSRTQLDLCDEIGLLVYEEPYSSQLFEDSPQMAARFDASTREMVLRDRNHPSVVIWGLLNETGESPQFRNAVRALSLVRSLDKQRMVLLSSGRFDGDLSIGSVSNPGSDIWQHLLGDESPNGRKTTFGAVPAYMEGVGDVHAYPFVPHTATEINFLRTLGESSQPIFISENGVASALDYPRLIRSYEQRGRGDSGECRFYRQAFDRFMADWDRWHLDDTFGRPEDYFAECLASMGPERLVAINAIRANPNIIGYTLTGTVDQGYTGEGLTTAFRELKQGTADAMFDGLAPLRWCLFAEPNHFYQGADVKLEAVLANEDALPAGEYPVRFEVFGPEGTRVFQVTKQIRIDDAEQELEPPLAKLLWSEQVRAEWPAGKYRFVATFEQGAAASGGAAEFQVSNSQSLPPLAASVVLCGDDEPLRSALTELGIEVREFDAAAEAEHHVYLIGATLPGSGGADFLKELASRITCGSSAVFLEPKAFLNTSNPGSLGAIGRKGNLVQLPNNVYHKDDWVKRHPIFTDLPAGGLMTSLEYRDLISNLGWSRPDSPTEAVAGSIYAFTAYDSGLTVSVDAMGDGKLILNTLRIREHLGKHPTADRLLLNMLIYAAAGLDDELEAESVDVDIESQFEAGDL